MFRNFAGMEQNKNIYKESSNPQGTYVIYKSKGSANVEDTY